MTYKLFSIMKIPAGDFSFMIGVKKRKVLYMIGVILFIITPFLSVALFCLKDGKMFWDVYLPLGGWSDEITYYKQIEGILSYGMPRGYFGYNQSRALYGTLGVWGLQPLLPYCLWGGGIGLGLCLAYLCEYLFLCVFSRDSVSAASPGPETDGPVFPFLVSKPVYKSISFIRRGRSVRDRAAFTYHCEGTCTFVKSESENRNSRYGAYGDVHPAHLLYVVWAAVL